MEHFTEDQAWVRAKDLAVHCYREFKADDTGNNRDLVDQIRKSAAQVAAHLAQDSGSKTSITGRLHLNTAIGSLKALESNLLVAAEVGAIRRDDLLPITNRIRELDDELLQMKRAVQAEVKSKMTERMSSTMGFGLDDE